MRENDRAAGKRSTRTCTIDTLCAVDDHRDLELGHKQAE
jgi:hypothetical protein